MSSGSHGYFPKGYTPWNSGQRVSVTCPVCGKEFSVPPSKLGRTKTCSKQCSYVLRGLNRRAPDTVVECRICGKEMIVKNRKHKPSVCSRSCYLQLLSESTKKTRPYIVFPRKDTSIEIKMQRFLSSIGIPFETHKSILGQPDIFIEPNICIFADGDYWHQYPNGRARDRWVNKELEKQGYSVIRIWEHDINAVLPIWVFGYE